MFSDKSTVDGGLKIKAVRETAEIPNQMLEIGRDHPLRKGSPARHAVQSPEVWAQPESLATGNNEYDHECMDMRMRA